MTARDALPWHAMCPEPAMTPALRIGIDGEALRAPLSGVGQYVLQLARGLEALLPHAHFHAYARLPAERLVLPSSRWTLRQEPVAAWRRLPSFLWLKTRGAALCRSDRLDVFWAGRTLHPHLPAPVRTVVTVHDLNHLLVPRTMEAATRWSHQLWLRGDVVGADIVTANSLGTAQRVTTHLGVAVDGVVTPGLEPRYRPLGAAERAAALGELARLGIEPPYLLSVGTLEPRKNVEALFRAYLALRRKGELAGCQLVLAGARGWKNEALMRELQAARSDGVVLPGHVPDALMPALYGCAQALVCPSHYEGYGMPVLEARACGTRVVVSDTPELRESGGAHAVVLAPGSAGLRSGLRRAVRLTPLVETGLTERHAWRRQAALLAALMTRHTPHEHRPRLAATLPQP
jgi:glycosyltransferase involved in cell wall biosynthesis